MGLLSWFRGRDLDADLKPLIEELRSSDEKAQFEAVNKLEKLAKGGDERLLGPLRDVLQSGNDGAREFAATLLGHLGGSDAGKALIGALGDRWWAVRYAAAEALGRIGDRRAVKPLRALASRDPHERVKGRAGIVLREAFKE